VALERRWRKHGFKFCFIGGITVQRWGQPRNTRDLDLTLLTGFGQEQPYIDAILNEYSPRRSDAHEFALLNRVLLIEDELGVPIDISLGAMPFEERAIVRSSSWSVQASASITTCSASDLIVHKAFAARQEDWIDVRGIIIRSADKLDWNLITDELTPLAELKGEPEILTRLEQLRHAT
jgi:hypothetical protein